MRRVLSSRLHLLPPLLRLPPGAHPCSSTGTAGGGHLSACLGPGALSVSLPCVALCSGTPSQSGSRSPISPPSPSHQLQLLHLQSTPTLPWVYPSSQGWPSVFSSMNALDPGLPFSSDYFWKLQLLPQHLHVTARRTCHTQRFVRQTPVPILQALLDGRRQSRYLTCPKSLYPWFFFSLISTLDLLAGPLWPYPNTAHLSTVPIRLPGLGRGTHAAA